MAEGDNKDAIAIRSIVDGWLEGCRRADPATIVADYDAAAVTFECHSVFRLDGVQAYRDFLTACFAHMGGGMGVEIADLDIVTGGDAAFCHFTGRFVAQGAGGEEHVSRLRATLCLRRIGGAWKVVHEHVSAPFDPMSGTAILDGGSALDWEPTAG
jgi:ketosteroid isomerase-like protein